MKRRRSPGADLPGTGGGGVACVCVCFWVVGRWWRCGFMVIVVCGGYCGVAGS